MTLITFSGLDGAGKTTLIRWLEIELRSRRHGVAVTHLNDDIGVYAYLRALRDRLAGRPRGEADPPRLARRTSGIGGLRDALVWSKMLRRALYPVDLLIFLCYRVYVEKLRRRILIMDRYFYDRLVDVADGTGWRLLRLLARLTPTPDLPVLLDISPEEAYARKGEYTVAYLRERNAAYHRVFPWVSAAVRVPARELEVAKRVLAVAVRERIER
jgi:hypothetical protein